MSNDKPTLIYPACEIYVLIQEWFDSLCVIESSPVERGDIGALNVSIRRLLESRNDHLTILP